MREIREIVEQAFALQKAGNLAGAQEIYEHLIGALDEPDPNVLLSYGNLLGNEGLAGLSAYLIREAIAHGFQDFAPAWSNLGITYWRLGRDERAKSCYDEALRLDPRQMNALCNLSGLHINQAEPQIAEHYARKALEVAPDDPQSKSHLALALLEQGRFEEAWPYFGSRWWLPERVKDQRPYKAPQWDGKELHGTLAIHGEQGVGDEILFCSRLGEAEYLCSRVVVECMDRLIPIFQRSFPNTDFYPNHDALIAAEGEPDAYCAMGDLFELCGLPDGEPYLARPPRADVLIDQERIRVGLAWRGGTPRTNKRERTTKLDDWTPILEVPGIEFVSVQYERDNVLEEAKQAGLKAEVISRDVDECARAIAGCDLVISVCQTAVHLAGAMGVPCWTLVPKRCAWRYAPWMGDQCAWYDSVRFYRQDDSEKWPPVIERIANDLRSFYG